MVGGCFRQKSRITHGKLLVMVYKVDLNACAKRVYVVCVWGGGNQPAPWDPVRLESVLS